MLHSSSSWFFSRRNNVPSEVQRSYVFWLDLHVLKGESNSSRMLRVMQALPLLVGHAGWDLSHKNLCIHQCFHEYFSSCFWHLYDLIKIDHGWDVSTLDWDIKAELLGRFFCFVFSKSFGAPELSWLLCSWLGGLLGSLLEWLRLPRDHFVIIF